MIGLRRLLLGLAAALLAMPLLTAPAHAETVRLGGVTVVLQSGTTQVVTVNHSSGHDARVSLWRLGPDGWSQVLTTTSGRTGYGGLVTGTKRKQGTGTTPLGTWKLLSAFGTHAADPAWKVAYRTIATGDYWVEDNASAYYNRYRNKSEGGFRWSLPSSSVDSSEQLTHYPTQYEYSIVTAFNYDRQTRHRGAGIFLHVNGKGATGGCVSAPRAFLQQTMAWLDPAQVPLIAIGR